MSADDSAADSAGARYEVCLHSLGLPFHDHAKDLSLLGPTPSDATPIGAPAKGSDDIPNIVYINAFPKDLDPKDFDELQEANEITSQFFSVRAAEQAEKQINKGALPADSSKEAQIKRANYRAYVIDYLTQKASWLRLTSTQNYNQKFSIAKDKFHTSLLNMLLAGLPIPESVYPLFERIFKGILSSIQETKNQTILQNQWILLFTYRWDETQRKIFTSHRTIYYEVNQSIKEYVSRKQQVTDVHLDFSYKQDDFALTETVWKRVKDDVNKAIGNNDIINSPLDIPV